jgi:hypothetical protein
MDDDNQKPAGFPPPSPMGNNSGSPAPTEKPKAPPPPPPEISIRTMKSDLESLKQTGGISPTPKTFVPPELEKIMQEEKPKAPPAPTVPPAAPSLRPTPPPTPAPAAPFPPRPAMPETTPPPRITPAEFERPAKEEMGKPEKKSAIVEEESGSKFNLRKLLIRLGALIIIVGVGLIGYFYIFPLLFPAQIPPPPSPVTTTPAPTEPAQAEPEIPEPSAPAFREHVSLLSAPTATSSVQLVSTDLASLLSALQTESQTPRPAGSLVEIILSDANGQISSADALASWLPDRSGTFQGIFEEDFTTALYYDSDGVWPIYIFNLSLDSSPVEAQTAALMLESSGALTNLFVNPPGNPNAAGFRDGMANGLATRYLTYSQRGAALNLAWSGDKFIISTSYNGLRQALNNLR